MKCRKSSSLAMVSAGFMLLSIFAAQNALAFLVYYTPVDLPNQVAGYDRWQYTFRIFDATHETFDGPGGNVYTTTRMHFHDILTFWFSNIPGYLSASASIVSGSTSSAIGWETFGGGSYSVPMGDSPYMGFLAASDDASTAIEFYFTVDWPVGDPIASFTPLITFNPAAFDGDQFRVYDTVLWPEDRISLRLEAGAGNGNQREVVAVGSWGIPGIQGWQWGICHDPDEVSIGSCSVGSFSECNIAACPSVKCTHDVLNAHNGTRADFVNVRICPTGVWQALVIDMHGAITMPQTDRFEMLRITYTLKATSAKLEYCDMPPCPGGMEQEVVFVVGGMSFPAAQQGITLIRTTSKGNGDVNVSGVIDIADAIYLLTFLFNKGPAPAEIECPPCPERQLPATGQASCQNATGALIDCASAEYPGQDGFYQKGFPTLNRFVDNGDGTVTDTSTNLMWQKDTVRGRMFTWQEALQYCESLTFANHGDWRLPNARELESIMDYGRHTPCINPVFKAEAERHWSSTPQVPEGRYAWMVDFSVGGVKAHLKQDTCFVRAVRNAN